jgi:ABC-type Fe3+-siderophore transport system permease subunit
MNSRVIIHRLIRLSAVAFAIGFGAVSYQFSKDGFGFSLPQYAWVGHILAAGIIVLEIAFNEGGITLPPLLQLAGVVAYAYGVVTNILGLWVAQGELNYLADWQSGLLLVVNITTSLMIEFVPEPLLLWGLNMETRDVLKSFLAIGRKVSKPISTSRPVWKERQELGIQSRAIQVERTVAERHGYHRPSIPESPPSLVE